METNLIIFINCTILNSISEVANIVIALGVIIAAFTYYSARKGNYLQTIEKCSQEYRGYMRQIQTKERDSTLKKDMLGLFHKQLFYIKNNYVPKDIKIEWLLTMHSVLIDKKYEKEGLEFCEKDYEDDFSRVKNFIALSKKTNSNSKTNEIKKTYKKYYFTRIERI